MPRDIPRSKKGRPKLLARLLMFSEGGQGTTAVDIPRDGAWKAYEAMLPDGSILSIARRQGPRVVMDLTDPRLWGSPPVKPDKPMPMADLAKSGERVALSELTFIEHEVFPGDLPPGSYYAREAIEGERFPPSPQKHPNLAEVDAIGQGDAIPMFTFGKYRNSLHSEVLKVDPGYISWAYRTVANHAGIAYATYAAACTAIDLDTDGEGEELVEGQDYPEPPRCWGDLDD